MQAEIISIGDELLIGQTINTNAAWMGERLNSAGFEVRKTVSIADKKDEIFSALNQSLQSAQIVLITGGLGPTKDDITKHALCEYFGTTLVRNEEVLHWIEEFFLKRGRVMLETNRQQADLPKDCQVLINKVGTASGMWFEKEGKIVVSMPGVPYEMKYLMEEEVMPRLLKHFNPEQILHRTILTQGIGESFLAEKIKDWENQLRKEGLSLAYLPSPGIVKLRITARGKDAEYLKQRIHFFEQELLPQIAEFHFGFEKENLEEIVGNMLREKKLWLSTAESCTGGFIAHKITSVSGSSDYFKGSIISYSNEIKINQLNVQEASLKNHGAVSQEVVEQMAAGVRLKLNTDYSVAVSGIAGPNGGSEEKPVGTVWIAVAGPKGVTSRKFLFENNRERNILRASLAALMMLRIELLKH
ncbi:MAG: competence/damage-inducible protein A [Flavobacteriales bacterium]|nr:competence/damage-inducible protein A [Flavobacteriales bacterium]